MKSVAVLLDGGFVRKELRATLRRDPTAEDVVELANGCVGDGEELFRIYYYDCLPFGGYGKNPLSGEQIDFALTPTYKNNSALLDQLKLKKHVAFRAGTLRHSGTWTIKARSVREIADADERQLEPADLKPEIRQKGVDIKIGLDIAWLSSKALVDKLILVTGDTDFVPAMKFARREGVQVVVVGDGWGAPLHQDLREHADEVRTNPLPRVAPPPNRPTT